MQLNRDEILGILGVLVHTMDLDHETSDDEVVFLDRFLDRMKIDPDCGAALIAQARSTEDLDEHVSLIKSRPARIYAMQHTLLLALADGEYRNLERAGLKILAERLSIDDVLFEDLERWALDGAEWQIRGAALLAR
jgi:hypothetical protein